MTFTPIVPIGGFVGWSFLKRTQEAQKNTFEQTPQLKRDDEYFREKIATTTSAEDLVKDSRLLRVALGAFGLDDDLPNKYFIRKILEDGTQDSSALANRLSNGQYKKLSDAFGFGEGGTPLTIGEGFADKILASYKERQFERAVGEKNNDMRLALNAERELLNLANSDSSERSKWFNILGNTPLKKIFETTFNLPTAFGTLDVDKQVDILERRTESMFGTSDIAQFADSENMDRLVRQFFVQSQLSNFVALSPNQIALNILSNGAGTF